MRSTSDRSRIVRRTLIAAVVAALAVPALALAHVERSSYFPDPAPDASVKPATGGGVPKVHSLASALKRKPPGRTRVVCQPDSLRLARKSIKSARKNGYDMRPTDHRRLSRKSARRLMSLNRRLARRCKYHEIQPAVTASGNNDRVVVMPGLYTEPTARKSPTNDPKCDNLEQGNDFGGGAVSYTYQATCPNDQNLIAVIGREPGKGQDPQPPRDDRHGIPNLGPCIRCNVQIEGSGVGADDVVIDAGRVASGNGGPADPVKDVGIRADRTDGFVLRNVTVRHAKEHDIYILEADGYVMENFKAFYAGEYGVLTFVEDHGLMQNCETVGSGDAGIYPGAASDTGDQHLPGDGPRLNQEIRFCDSHHNALGFSATNGNAVHVHDVNFYDNVQGLSTDVFTAAGHPGFPADSMLVEHNNFYSNNFNAYAKGSDVKPSVPVPVGVGAWIAGGDHHTFRDNRFYDNWRRGMMVFAVPDATVCTTQSQSGCNPGSTSTSFNNQLYGNVMGIAPDGSAKPNGTDFWWDSFPGNTGNCWFGNKPAAGRSITTSPSSLPDCAGGKDPGSSRGTGTAPQNEAELGNCLGDFTFNTGTCDWFRSPPKP